MVLYCDMKNPLIFIVIISVLLIGGAVWYSDSVAKKSNVGVEVVTAVKGNPDASVVLEEFADFQCPACGQFHPYVKEIMDEYGDQVRLEFRHFPLIQFHPYAEPAARAAEAAGQQGKFFEFHDKLFENQAEWSNGGNPSLYFNQYAEELGLDMDTFATHQKSSVIRDHIRSDLSEGRERGVEGTPTFFLNGEKVEMKLIGDLKASVESALGIVPDVSSTTATTTDATSGTKPNAPTVKFGL